MSTGLLTCSIPWFLSHWWGQYFLTRSLLSTPRSCVFGLIRAYHSSSTLPMSPYKYNEWWSKVEIGIHFLQWSAYPGFLVKVGVGINVGLRFIPLDIVYTQIMCTWIGKHIIAAELSQCVIICVMNDEARVRLKYIMSTGQYSLCDSSEFKNLPLPRVDLSVDCDYL